MKEAAGRSERVDIRQAAFFGRGIGFMPHRHAKARRRALRRNASRKRRGRDALRVELAFGKVTSEQVAERQAVDAVAVAGNGEVVGVRIISPTMAPTLNNPDRPSLASHTSMFTLVRKPPMTVMNMA